MQKSDRIRKISAIAIAIVMEAFVSMADVAISNLKVEPIMPRGRVFLQYDVEGSLPENHDQFSLHISARNSAMGIAVNAGSLTGDVDFALGTHRVVWDLSSDCLLWLGGQTVKFSVSYETSTPPLYKVVQLYGGTSASRYTSYTCSEAPAGGWNENLYKTSEMVLRRVDAGAYLMQNNSEVILTKPFYIGVFEVTQRQWELVMGTRPSNFTNNIYYASRPVEKVSYNMVRGSLLGAEWPVYSSVDPSSFLGVLRKKVNSILICQQRRNGNTLAEPVS